MENKTKLSVVKTGGTESRSTTRAPGASSRKTSKQDAILREAALLFNAHGVGAVGFGDLARHMGVGRATFYHYVADREDLIFRCYQKSSEAETERLDSASEAAPGLPVRRRSSPIRVSSAKAPGRSSTRRAGEILTG